MAIFDNITPPSSIAGVSAGCGGNRCFSAHLWLVARHLLFSKILFFSLKSAAYLFKYCNKSEGPLISHHALFVVTRLSDMLLGFFIFIYLNLTLQTAATLFLLRGAKSVFVVLAPWVNSFKFHSYATCCFLPFRRRCSMPPWKTESWALNPPLVLPCSCTGLWEWSMSSTLLLSSSYWERLDSKASFYMYCCFS